MCSIFTTPHIGILLTIAGTVCLAISVKSNTQYSGDEFMEDCVQRARKDGAFVPTYTYIDKKLFYTGLGLVAAGSFMQW
jgi:N-acetylglutamate synthase-like GNAT family acetyltransferase